MEQAFTLEAVSPVDESPLAHARLHRQLTIDEAARRANVSPEEIQWLQEGAPFPLPHPGSRPHGRASLHDGARDRPPRGARTGRAADAAASSEQVEATRRRRRLL